MGQDGNCRSRLAADRRDYDEAERLSRMPLGCQTIRLRYGATTLWRITP
jgi:hypothetical protein